MVTAEKVKELREATGCGMMDCKKALTETNGDIEKAIEHLREKGLAAVAKKAGRIAAEGMVEAFVFDNGVGVVVEINSETDFVAKNEEFKSFVHNVAEHISQNNVSTVDELYEQKFLADNSKTVREALNEKIAVIGENMNIRRFQKYDMPCEAYIHGGGRIGVLVQFKLGNNDLSAKAEFKEYAKNIAMQIAAANPAYVDRSLVPTEVLEKEKEILKAQALNEGKPEAIVEKMIVGRVEKYYKDVCIVDQPYIKNPDVSVFGYTKEFAGSMGTDVSIVAFVRFEKGEGLQKKEDDFASEVAKMTQG